MSPPLAPSSHRPGLDDTVRTVRAGLKDHHVPPPDVLYLMATGVGLLPDHLRSSIELPLSDVAGMPAPWSSRVLHAGTLGECRVWMLEDAADDPLDLEPHEGWVRGLPLWLAAASGAVLCMHTAAGSALCDEGSPPRPLVPVGGFAILRDHINWSGRTPLLGLGGSTLGPLFPDQTRLHHLGLRHAALERAEGLGLAAAEAVAALTPGPSLETPAERRMLARLGAEVAVQSLAWPLLAAVHAGLSVLSVVAITDAGEAPTDVAGLVEAAAEAQPALEDLALALVEDMHGAVQALTNDQP